MFFCAGVETAIEIVIQLGKGDIAGLGLGGKATNLDRLLRAGLPVPPALAIFPQQADWSEQLVANVEVCLGRGPYFVRSSFAVEDQAAQSFAGQGLTVGHVDRSQLADAVRSVWQSWDSPHAKAYRKRMRLDNACAGSVIVQKEAIPVWSGVLFTQSPEAIGAWARIEAVKGYGEALVQGKTTPVVYEFHRRSLKALDDVVDSDLSLAVKALAPWIERLEVAAAGPADVEWCLDARNRIWILQVRPAAVDRQQMWSAALGEEFWSGQVSRLMFSTVGMAIEQAMLREPLSVLGRRLPDRLLRAYGGRIYVDVGALSKALAVVPHWAVSDRLLELFPPHLRARFLRERRAHAPWLPRELFSVGRRFLAQGFPWLPLQQPNRLPVELQKAEAWRRKPVATGAALTGEIDLLLVDLTQTLRSVVWGVMYAYLFAPLLERALGRFAGRSEAASFYQALPNDPVYELDREWFNFAERHADALALPTWQAVVDSGKYSQALADYSQMLDKWGHRAEERDIAAPRWADHPASVWQVARLAAQRKKSNDLPKWWAWTLTTVAPVYLPWRWPRALALLLVGWLMRLYVGYRERMRDLSDRYLTALRQRFIVLADGREPWGFAWRQGRLTTECPAYDAPFDQAPPLPRFLIGDRPLEVAEVGNGMVGVGVSSGQGQGRAVWIRAIDDLSKFQPGSVMLAEYLDPSFSLALEASAGAAFVSGGMLSHGAIVAREYGVPAVVGVSGLSAIRDGALLRIDGDHGRVEVLDD